MMWQQVLGYAVAAALIVLLARQFLAARRSRLAAPFAFFGEATAVLEKPSISAGETAGVYLLTGRYRGHEVQVKAITDTLAVRKLPSLWLMVTLPGPLPVKAVFDMMMRPSGPTTFSNFDHLPHTVELPPDFPEHAVIRTDDPRHLLPPHVVSPHLDFFQSSRGKELLITPKGLRLVALIAEADRARYGVFRQADFGDSVLEPARLQNMIETLLALRLDIENWHKPLS